MDWLSKDIAQIPRMDRFPFRVKMLFFCQHRIYSTGENSGTTPENWLEITVRLASSGSTFCNDIINGEQLHEPYPHAVWKKPGGIKHLDGEAPRDAISFGYSSDVLEKFRDLGLYPEHTSRAFFMTDEIRRLIQRFKSLCLRLYSPGVADEIDWVCFQLHRELLHSGTANKEERQTDAERIRNISVWMQQHLHEEINLDEVAGANGYSHAVFFRKWKEVFRVSPLQYILDQKIKSAAKLLQETELPVSQIVREIHYSGQTAFYRRFIREYGLTPDQFRKKRND
ncbi:MAG: helix-turn-helix transcriptional regulator [Lentisphaeria bacterium]|nr:helix-turn-helix transcriptional regulator [Lentisphaeria bacterium]